MKKVNIIIIDDQEEHVKDIEDKLNNSQIGKDIEIFSAKTIEDGKKTIGMGGCDIVVLDLNLPPSIGKQVKEGGGKDLIGFIKNHSPSARIILLTGETRIKLQDQYLNEDFPKGIDDYILKDSRSGYIEQIVKKISYLVPIIQEMSGYTKEDNLIRIAVFDDNAQKREKIINRIKNEFERKNGFNKGAQDQYQFLEYWNLQSVMQENEYSLIDVLIVNVDKKESFELIDALLKQRQDIPITAISFKEGLGGFGNLKAAHKHGAITSARFLDDGTGRESDYFKKALQEAIKYRKDIKYRENLFKPFALIKGSHPSLIKAFALASIASKNDAPVVILGESGTGKDLLTKAIHELYKKGEERPFVAINCAAIPEGLLESELFGYKKGAHSFAYEDKRGLLDMADNGTVFLDEISEMSIKLQAKLLRFLEDGIIRPLGGHDEKKVKVKVISATNKNLKLEVQNGRFRNDLYQRLNAFSIYLPPIRERKSDLKTLVYYFIDLFSKEYEKGVLSISEKALELIKSLNFEKGNVRELKNIMESLIARLPSGRERIEINDLNEIIGESLNNSSIGYSIFIPSRDFTSKEIAIWSKWIAMIEILRNCLTPDRHVVKQKLDIVDSTYFEIHYKGIALALKVYNDDWEKFCQDFYIQGSLKQYFERLKSNQHKSNT